MAATGRTDDGSRRYRWAAGAWAVVTSVALLAPLSGESWPGLQWAPGWLGRSADEVAHAGLFFVLAWLLLQGFEWSRWRWVVTACVLYGVGTEMAQGRIEGRSGEISDLVADLLGVGLAVALFLTLEGASDPSL